MENQNIQQQLAELNKKVDLIFEYVAEQRKKQQMLEDLGTDLYRVGKEVFKNAVTELDNRDVKLDTEQVQRLFFTILQNIETFNSLFYALRVFLDFLKDAYPIAKEMIIDLTYELDRLQKDGVFDSLRVLIDNLKNPKFLQKIAQLTTAISKIQIDDNDNKHSFLQIIKELNDNEVKKGILFSLRLIKEITKN